MPGFRTLIRVVSCDERQLHVYLPAYSCYVYLKRTDVPAEIWNRAEPNYRFHARVVVEDKDGSYRPLQFSEWEPM